MKTIRVKDSMMRRIMRKMPDAMRYWSMMACYAASDLAKQHDDEQGEKMFVCMGHEWKKTLGKDGRARCADIEARQAVRAAKESAVPATT